MTARIPAARFDQVVVQELGDETLVYDLARHRAHCLNRASAIVWKACDGRRTAAEIAGALHRELGLPADEEIVWHAIGQLEGSHLLAAGAVRPGLRVASRRSLLKRAAAIGGAALALPLVTSIVAPTAVSAQTVQIGGEEGSPCMPTEPRCQPGLVCCESFGDICVPPEFCE